MVTGSSGVSDASLPFFTGVDIIRSHSSAMLSNDEVMQARAQHMTSTNKNQRILYDGNAVAWQGANRVEADTLDIDRDNGGLV